MRFGILIIILTLLSCEQNSNLTNWLKEDPFFNSQNLFSNERFPNLVISNLILLHFQGFMFNIGTKV